MAKLLCIFCDYFSAEVIHPSTGYVRCELCGHKWTMGSKQFARFRADQKLSRGADDTSANGASS